MKKEEVLTMLTSFTQGNRLDYAEKIYEIMENHLQAKKQKPGKIWHGEFGELNVDKRPPTPEAKDCPHNYLHVITDRCLECGKYCQRI